MIEAFIKGARYPFIGLRWLPRPRLRRFVIVPLLINTLMFAAVIVWGAQEFGIFMDWLLSYLPTWLDWLRWLMWPLFAVATLLVMFYTFTLAANLIASPFNGLLAEQVEALIRSHVALSSGRPLWKEIVLAPLAELIKLGYFLVRALPLLVLFVIPGVNAIAPALWLVFGAWMLALQYADYPMGNHGVRFPEQRRLLGARWPLALGFGTAVLGLTLIPVVNFLVMPAAVIGATLMWVEHFAPAPPTPVEDAAPTTEPPTPVEDA
jgi:CysZ protein